MRTKTARRVLALQALYQFDLHGPDFVKDLPAFLRDAAKDEPSFAFARELVEGWLGHRDNVDARIAEAAEHWDVARMAAVDRAILRLGAYELLHQPDLPPKVAIDEAIRLAKKFSTAESGAFVNGILDRIMAAHAPSQTPAPEPQP
jgi:N utilization substance protein B